MDTQHERRDAHFAPGQLIHHKLFDYRGVVTDVDPMFQGSEQWYEQVAKSRPPKDAPWYHVLVDGGEQTTYVAERNLEPDDSVRPIEHPLIGEYFTEFNGEGYTMRQRWN